MSERLAIGVLGGTGAAGGGLALRWARKGHEVILGSRSALRAAAAAQALKRELGESARVRGASNEEAARAGSVVVLAVPYAAQLPVAESVREALEGKVLIDVTAPLVPPRVDRVQLPEGGSAVLALQRRLGASVRVVSAFQNVAAELLREAEREIDCDVLVCGDDPGARELAVRLARDAGLRAWHAGALANSAAAEALTSVLIAINKRYRARAAGIRITGVAEERP
jgi:NADPH-dependent F420 reductase